MSVPASVNECSGSSGSATGIVTSSTMYSNGPSGVCGRFCCAQTGDETSIRTIKISVRMKNLPCVPVYHGPREVIGLNRTRITGNPRRRAR